MLLNDPLMGKRIHQEYKHLYLRLKLKKKPTQTWINNIKIQSSWHLVMLQNKQFNLVSQTQSLALANGKMNIKLPMEMLIRNGKYFYENLNLFSLLILLVHFDTLLLNFYKKVPKVVAAGECTTNHQLFFLSRNVVTVQND